MAREPLQGAKGQGCRGSQGHKAGSQRPRVNSEGPLPKVVGTTVAWPTKPITVNTEEDLERLIASFTDTDLEDDSDSEVEEDFLRARSPGPRVKGQTKTRAGAQGQGPKAPGSEAQGHQDLRWWPFAVMLGVPDPAAPRILALCDEEIPAEAMASNIVAVEGSGPQPQEEKSKGTPKFKSFRTKAQLTPEEKEDLEKYAVPEGKTTKFHPSHDAHEWMEQELDKFQADEGVVGVVGGGAKQRCDNIKVQLLSDLLVKTDLLHIVQCEDTCIDEVLMAQVRLPAGCSQVLHGKMKQALKTIHINVNLETLTKAICWGCGRQT